MARYQETFSTCSEYEAKSLDSVTDRLSSIRSRQEAELDVLSQTEDRASYEDMARMQLAEEGRGIGELRVEIGQELEELSVR